MEKEYFISGTKANKFMILLIIPIVLIAVLPYLFIWGTGHLNISDPISFMLQALFLFITLILSFILHELIHGISWRCFVQNGWKSLKFGILWNQMMLYCHCEEPLTARQYRIGLLMPTIILGIIPIVIAWTTGSGFLLAYGIIMTAGGGGDLMIYGLMSKVNSDTMVKDYPKEIGFTVEE